PPAVGWAFGLCRATVTSSQTRTLRGTGCVVEHQACQRVRPRTAGHGPARLPHRDEQLRRPRPRSSLAPRRAAAAPATAGSWMGQSRNRTAPSRGLRTLPGTARAGRAARLLTESTIVGAPVRVY